MARQPVPAGQAATDLDLDLDGPRGRFSSSLRAGLAILNSFSAEDPVLGIAKLAERLQMSRSTTHRYASTLVALGFLEQDDRRRYRLAPRVADVGLSLLSSMELRRLARPHLLDLRSETGRTVSLAVLDGSEIRYVERLPGWRRGQYAVNLDLRVGARLPAYCSAMGKVLLAHLPEPQRELLIDQIDLHPRGPRSITDPDVLRGELDRIASRGLATGDEELSAGVRAIAVGIPDRDGDTTAAIGIPVPADAFSVEGLYETLGPPLVATAQRISAALAA